MLSRNVAVTVGVIFQDINIKITHDNDFFIFIRKFFKNVLEKNIIKLCYFHTWMSVYASYYSIFSLSVYYLNKDRFKFFVFVDFQVISYLEVYIFVYIKKSTSTAGQLAAVGVQTQLSVFKGTRNYQHILILYTPQLCSYLN